MKRNYILCLLGILNICHITFAMLSPENYTQEVLKLSKQLINEKQYDKVIKYYLEDFNRRRISESAYEQGHKKIEQLLLQLLQNAQKLVNQGNYEEVYDILNQFADLEKNELNLINAIKDIEKLLFSTAQQFAQKNIYTESFTILSKLKTISINPNLIQAIKDLEKKLSEPLFKKVRDYAKIHQYKDAYDILNTLRTLQIKEVAILELEIKQQEAAWKQTQEPVASVEQKWLFIKQMPPTTQERLDPKSDWNVTKKKELILNLNATEVLTQETFETLIKQAKDSQLPFILVTLQSNPTKFFPYFFDKSIIAMFMKAWGFENQLVFENPINREKVINIEIYVMGDDGILRLLKDNVDVKYLNQFVDSRFEFKPALEKKGLAQVFIADLYKKEAKPDKQQLERLWLSWALPKFSLPADAAQAEQATQRMNAIPNRPELIPGKVEIEPPVQPVQPPPTQLTKPVSSKALLSMLQNFNIKLRQLAQELKQL